MSRTAHGILRTTADPPRSTQNANILAFPANGRPAKPYENYEDYEDRAREWDSRGTAGVGVPARDPTPRPSSSDVASSFVGGALSVFQ